MTSEGSATRWEWEYPRWRVSTTVRVGPTSTRTPRNKKVKMSCRSNLMQYRECPVCLEDMLDSDPRVLSCLHSFCAKCLRGMKASNYYTDKFSYSITCPTCRAVTKLNSMSDLQSSVSYKQAREVIDKLYAGRLCQLCTEVEPRQWCETCDQRLCDACKEQHDVIAAFRDHVFHSLNKSRHKCAVHGKDLIYVCIPCAKEVCFDCVRTEHSEHNDRIEEYGRYMSQHVEEIRHCRDDIKPHATSLERRLEAMREYDRSLWAVKDEIKKASLMAIAQIKEEGEQMINILDEMMVTIGKEKTTTKDLLNDTVSFLQQSTEERKDVLTKVEQVARLYEQARRIIKTSSSMNRLQLLPVTFCPTNNYSVGSLEGAQMSTTESDED